MNRVQLYGNVGADPDVKILQSGKTVAKFSLATNKSYTNSTGEKITETSWHNIVLWGKVAETASKYVKKGSSIILEGEISYRTYENKEGQTVYVTEIVGKALHFVGSKKEEKPENNEDKWQGKKDVKSMSDPAELDASYVPENIPDDLPY